MDPITSRFLDLARANPDSLAAIGPERAWSRSDLAERALEFGRAWGSELESRDRGRGSIVGLRVSSGAGFLAAFLALRLSGACVLLLDAGLTAGELDRIARALGATCLWDSEAILASPTLRADSITWLPGQARVPEAACLKLTSGSSGDPAGVIIPPESLLHDGLALIDSMGLREEDRLLAAVPMSHSYGLSVIASPAWLLGCPVVFPGDLDTLRAAAAFDASFLPSVPSWFEAQLNAESPRRLPTRLRLLMSAGAPLRPTTARKWSERFGLGIHVLYGSSECGGITYDRVGDAAEHGSVGTAVEGVRIELDESGHVIVHSKATALGYWPKDEARGERLSPGCFRTEDLGHWEGERLYLSGRRSHWINVKGHKVNPLEVESVLCEHPDIIDAAVIGRTLSDGRGEAIHAFVVCGEGSVHFRDILDWCRPRLARHKYPRGLVLLPELPRTERGKLDRRALSRL